jgi:23S rRNA (uracil1939-C5)-methyltransferase
MSKIQTLEISSLSYGGDGFGRLPDGRACFVPFSLPGEHVRVALTEEKAGHARARLLEILRPAPERIPARCQHFGACGGCHYQHLPYPAQLAAKERIFSEQLSRIAGILNPPVLPIVPSPQEWNYRNTVQFTLSPQGKPGYQAAGSHQVVEIEECWLPEAALNEFWPALDLEAVADIDRVELRLGASEELLVTFESSEAYVPDFEFSTEADVSVVHLSPDGIVLLAGDDFTTLEVLGRPFRVSAGAFFQINTGQAAAMVEHLLEILPTTPQTSLLDVYCGVGLFSAFFAGRVGLVSGVELSEPACRDFAFNLDEFENVSLYQGAAEDVLPGLDFPVDVAIVDPPRAGLARPALDALLQLALPRLAYISCDPSTLARDAKRLLAGGYQLTQATPFDLFPQTYHIESISLFEKP